ncbi:hypothetical protein ILUMI_25716 [Ignelater luminosus]|uniref:Uncharacterized protein n=1 Tax=Ignelater luminosus TaxID=2038154 RepID=A0A8K0FZM7_IGNLU|nr:hypothetical protein ILUMI_25716 [Ignelater luminosus]
MYWKSTVRRIRTITVLCSKRSSYPKHQPVIDYVITQRCSAQCIRDARVKKGAEIRNDYNLVMLTRIVPQAITAEPRKNTKPKKEKICFHKLNIKEIRKVEERSQDITDWKKERQLHRKSMAEL